MRFSLADRFFPAELSLFGRALLCCPAFSPVRRPNSSHAERFSLADQACLGPSLALCPAPLFAPNLLLPPYRPSRTLRPFSPLKTADHLCLVKPIVLPNLFNRFVLVV